MSFRLGVYRSLGRQIVEPWILPWAVSPERHRLGREHSLLTAELAPREKRGDRAWFHAASVGELESLWPVIEKWLSDPKREAVVTILSESAARSLERLAVEVRGRVIFHGYAPWEGTWGDALARAQPGLFVTAKYEAWPELWASLARERIPLAIVGARRQRSLVAAKWFCRVLGTSLPDMTLLASEDSEASALREIFPGAEIRVSGEPRWDRVFQRAGGPSARVTELARSFDRMPRPWLILGSAWPEDIRMWRDSLGTFTGTAWVVPHKVDAASIAAIEETLAPVGRKWARTSRGETDGQGILVDEMGILSELYAHADLAYVGGGLGAGVHSTIEPAIQGIPLAAGPKGQHRFAEIPQLLGSGQLQLIRSSSEAERWLSEATGKLQENRPRWRTEATERTGATARVLESLVAAAKACYP